MMRILASWFGTGLILNAIRGSHMGSGTVGAAFAFPLAYLVGLWWGWPAQVAAALLVAALAVWSASRFVPSEGDAGWIVVDEAAGVFVAVIGLRLWPAIVAWLVFRAADIFKKLAPGVSAAENLDGATGVTADDLVAALYGLVAGHLVQALA